MSSRFATHVILLLAQVCFASLPVVGRLAMLGQLPPAGIVLVRVVGGAIVFSVIAWRRGVLRIERGDIKLLLVCAVLGIAANQELFIHGLALSTATNASVLGSTIPVFTVLAAFVLGREPARARRLVGIAIAFAGASALVGADRLSTSHDHLVGSAMVLANSLCYGTYLVLVRRLAEKYDPVALLAWMFVAAIPMVAPLGAVAWANTRPIDGNDLAYLGFMVAIPTVAAYGLVQIALRRAEASLVASYIYLQPVFAVVGAMLVLGEQPTIRTAIFGSVVLFGVWLAARSRRP